MIHRDLACRNILIGDQKNLKISDFGMSRYLPRDEVYVPMSHGLLPLRWMAIESIHVREFTTASDIWSYGVVLWELCTMCKYYFTTVHVASYLHAVLAIFMVDTVVTKHNQLCLYNI